MHCPTMEKHQTHEEMEIQRPALKRNRSNSDDENKEKRHRLHLETDSIIEDSKIYLTSEEERDSADEEEFFKPIKENKKQTLEQNKDTNHSAKTNTNMDSPPENPKIDKHDSKDKDDLIEQKTKRHAGHQESLDNQSGNNLNPFLSHTP